MITINKAAPNEITLCYKLIQKLAVYEGEDSNSIISLKEFINLTSTTSPIFHILTAKKNNIIAGIAIYYYRYSTWKGKHIHLEDLFVDESYRNEGIGKLLMEKLISIAKTERLKRIEWEVHSINMEAKNFYKKMGAEISEIWQISRLEL